jgi:LysR family glycine cleavage system transcriptional activator
MRRHLPPLTALRAFEAAARRLSFARAAEELNVTPAAISHQVKALEEWLGVRLFYRHNAALRLTPSGVSYLHAVADGFDRLSRSTEDLAVGDAHNTLSIVVPPTIASRWLVPRLNRFRDRHPKIQLRVTIGAPPVDFSQYNFDIAVAFGGEATPNLLRQPWLTYNIIAVCSPALVRDGSLSSYEDLARHSLLHDEALKIQDRIDWKVWLDLMGGVKFDTDRGVHFSHATHAYQMAVDGHGVTLAKDALIAVDLSEGRLVKLFNHSVSSDLAYDIVYPEAMAASSKVISFRDWLLQEAANDHKLRAQQPRTSAELSSKESR